MIKRYEVRNLLLDDELILKNVTGCNIHRKESRRLATSPPEVLLLLTPKLPRTTMTRRGTWWEYFSSG